MRAVVFDEFSSLPEVREVPDPVPSADGVGVRVETTGLCRSDVHGWPGHDNGISLAHVSGHKLVGTIASIGPRVRRFAVSP